MAIVVAHQELTAARLKSTMHSGLSKKDRNQSELAATQVAAED
jgi:hypothetical protein